MYFEGQMFNVAFVLLVYKWFFSARKAVTSSTHAYHISISTLACVIEREYLPS